jgi:hypothetical protein
LAEEGVRIEPCVAGTSNAVVICEGCPASVLNARGWPKRGYKGAGEPPRALRAQLLRQLGEWGVVVPPAMAEEATRDEEGDVLDAIILATPPFAAVVPAVGRVEGWVY